MASFNIIHISLATILAAKVSFLYVGCHNQGRKPWPPDGMTRSSCYVSGVTDSVDCSNYDCEPRARKFDS